MDTSTEIPISDVVNDPVQTSVKTPLVNDDSKVIQKSEEAALTTPPPQGGTSKKEQEQLEQPTTSPALLPNRTLYVKNLNSKIKLNQLKKDLRSIFENFGIVQTVIAMSSFWRRGQAWIIFSDQASADKALVQLQGFPYSGKEIIIQYARELSDCVAKEEGTFKPRPPGPKKPHAILEREKKLQLQLQQFQQLMLRHLKQQKTDLPAATPTLPQFPPGLIPPQLPALMFNQIASSQQQQQQQQQQQLPFTINQQSQSHTPHPTPLYSANSYVQQQQPHLSFSSTVGANLINSQTGTPAQLISKDAVVAAAAAAAAQAVEAAAKKRAIENDTRSQTHKVPKLTSQLDLTSRFSAPPNLGNPAAVAAAVASAAAAAVSGSAPSGFPRGLPMSANPPPPNRTLFVEQLPEDCDTKTLETIFKRYPGCGEIRHIPSRRVAFVDYETIAQANMAIRFLNNFPIKEGCLIRVFYARQ